MTNGVKPGMTNELRARMTGLLQILLVPCLGGSRLLGNDKS